MTPSTATYTHVSQLEDLLAEGISGAVQRERTAFDELTHPFSDSLILFGARKLGRKTLVGLRRAGIECLAFCDNNPAIWGTIMDGVRIFSPEEAARNFGDRAAFVITIWGRGSWDLMAERKRQLSELGCKTVVPFVPLFWKYPDIFLPHLALDLPHKAVADASEILRCFAVLSDEQSRRELVRQVTWRITGNFDALSDPIADELYFPHEIANASSPEVFIDCGAYDGDTILRFVQRRGANVAKIFAFEPDPTNFQALKSTVAALPAGLPDRTYLSGCAVGATDGTVHFNGNGTLSSSMGSGDLEIECVRLDRVLATEAPTYVKMDIEGAEPEALFGAQELIRAHAPVIAACSYHIQNHAWRIPTCIYDINPEYAILLRPHNQLVEDLVSYAVPKQRLAA